MTYSVLQNRTMGKGMKIRLRAETHLVMTGNGKGSKSRCTDQTRVLPVSKELAVTAGLLLPGGAVSTRASQEETQDWIARVALRSHQRSWKQKTEQNSRFTAVFSEILAKNRKPQKSHLLAPCVSVSTKSQCHH